MKDRPDYFDRLEYEKEVVLFRMMTEQEEFFDAAYAKEVIFSGYQWLVMANAEHLKDALRKYPEITLETLIDLGNKGLRKAISKYPEAKANNPKMPRFRIYADFFVKSSMAAVIPIEEKKQAEDQ